MTELSTETRTAPALEVVIPWGATAFAFSGSRLADGPTLGAVVEVVTALNVFVDKVARAERLTRVMRTYGVEEWPPPAGSDPTQRERTLETTLRHSLLIILPERTPRLEDDRALLRIRSMSMNSPLTIEAIATGVLGAGGISALVYLFKNPEQIGQWWPKVQASWYDGQIEAQQARTAYRTLAKAETEMRALEDGSGPAE